MSQSPQPADDREATPITPSVEVAPGVNLEPLAVRPGHEAPVLYRLTIAPGVTYAMMTAPELLLSYIEAGTLAVSLNLPVTVTRGTAGTSPGEPMPAAAEFTMQAGDYTVLPLKVEGQVRNDGEQPTVLLLARIVLTESSGAGATPTA